MIIMKFGGSSVADAQKIRHVASIIERAGKTARVGVVCSAMKGITDLLIEAATIAESGDAQYTVPLGTIRERTLAVIDDLFPDNSTIHTRIEKQLSELSDILHGIELVRECSPRSMDLIMSFGERMNNMIIAAFLNASGHKAEYIDTRKLIVTDAQFGNASVLLSESYKRIRQEIARINGIPVITGFIAATEQGYTTTLGRNGSDYTASLVGAALDSERVEIWTDVDGVLSADPRYVPNAFVLPEISIEDAMELSYFGAEVIHPYTMLPAVDRDIDIYIKNTLAPEVPGTRISRKAPASISPITGVASIESVALMNIEGGGMLGMPGVASKVFRILSEALVNVIMISQASSEHSICIVCRGKEIKKAETALRKGLEQELMSKKIQRIDIQNNLEIVAIVGKNMKGQPGISGRLFSALGNAGVNVLAIAQGSSERNISFVIQSKEREAALRTVHAAFLE
ncbi:MAG: aspartate kinase [Spirochaetales bacterium]|nr:aspartate kinase [Spirochaetales bacterium]